MYIHTHVYYHSFIYILVLYIDHSLYLIIYIYILYIKYIEYINIYIYCDDITLESTGVILPVPVKYRKLIFFSIPLDSPVYYVIVGNTSSKYI